MINTGYGVCFSLFASVVVYIMAQFDIELFLSTPSLEQVDVYSKDDQLALGHYFDVPVTKHMQEDIRRLVVQQLVAQGILPVLGGVAGQIGQATPVVGVAVEESPPQPKPTLPWFELLSLSSSGQRGEAQLRVRLARLEIKQGVRAEQ